MSSSVAQIAKLRALIKASGLSINGWAKQVTPPSPPQGVNIRTVRRWLSGTTPVPKWVLAKPRPEPTP